MRDIDEIPLSRSFGEGQLSGCPVHSGRPDAAIARV